MKIKLLEEKDVKIAFAIISDAIDFLKNQNIDQWQNNYPNLETIINDISNKTGYVLIDNNEILAYVSISLEKEVLYEEIKTWKCNKQYAILHRVAVKSNLRNKKLFNQLIFNITNLLLANNIHCIRIDTHPDNKIMKKALSNNNFKYIDSMIYDQGLRLAYELCLEDYA